MAQEDSPPHVSWSSPRGNGGKSKMKHLVPEPRDVTLSIGGLRRLPRGSGRVPEVGEPNTNSCCPPAPSQRDRAAAQPSAATERQCPLVAMLTQQQQRSGKLGGRCTGFGRERRQVR